MKTEIENERFARVKMTEYVNGCECDNREDVIFALQKMIAISMEAMDVVENGTMEVVQ